MSFAYNPGRCTNNTLKIVDIIKKKMSCTEKLIIMIKLEGMHLSFHLRIHSKDAIYQHANKLHKWIL